MEVIENLHQKNIELQEENKELKAEVIRLNSFIDNHEAAVEQMQETFNNLDMALKIKDEKLNECYSTIESCHRVLKLLREENNRLRAGN